MIGLLKGLRRTNHRNRLLRQARLLRGRSRAILRAVHLNVDPKIKDICRVALGDHSCEQSMGRCPGKKHSRSIDGLMGSVLAVVGMMKCLSVDMFYR